MVRISNLYTRWSIIWAFLFFVLALSCSKESNNLEEGSELLQINAVVSETKTALSGTSLNWVNGDNLGMYLGNLHSNNIMIFNSGIFKGFFTRKNVSPCNLQVYSYYPYNINAGTSNIIDATLPKTQTAPFDSKADYMVSNATSINYDESNMPTINLTFSRHLFSILKFTITNTEETLKEEKLYGIKLQSASHTLSGSFSFDVSLGNESTAQFSNDLLKTNKSVSVEYKSGQPTIGLGENHTLYLVVPAGAYESGDLSVQVYTENEVFTQTINKSLSLNNGTIYTIQPLDIKSAEKNKRYKTVLTFGDSITTLTMAKWLQGLLGAEWKVYNAGVSGEKAIQIMARTGAIPTYIKDAFTIPASSETSVPIGTTFYTTMKTDGSYSAAPDVELIYNLAAYTSQSAVYCGCANPFMVNGVECEITKNGAGVLMLRRTADGDAVDCNEYTQVIPAAKWKLGNPTLTTLYMGTNGAYTANATTGRNSNQVLADMHKIVENATTGHFMAVGYHHSRWDSAYKSVFDYEFSAKHNFLDLRTEGCAKAVVINSLLGLPMSAQDNTNISKVIWPESWGGIAIHPNTYGAKAYAYLVYYKMKEMGLAD